MKGEEKERSTCVTCGCLATLADWVSTCALVQQPRKVGRDAFSQS